MGATYANGITEKAMIEITISEKAEIELLKVLRQAACGSVRLIQQGYG
jgi:hypothetical protein